MEDMKHQRANQARAISKQGVAAVETAIILPVLMIIILGAIDVGQSFDVWNRVENASREGARFAVRATTTSNSEVADRVTTSLSNAFPNVSASELSSGLSITIRNGDGGVVTDLTTVPTGQPISVQVSLDYNAVRWLRGIRVLASRDITTTTQMRRE